MIGNDEWHERLAKSIAGGLLILPEMVIAAWKHGCNRLSQQQDEPVVFSPVRRETTVQKMPENVVPIIDADQVLKLLKDAGVVNNSELAELMRKRLGYGSDATAHRIVNNLERKGLVTKERDGRQVVIRAA